MPLGNHIVIKKPKDPDKKEFTINSTQSFMECMWVLAQKVEDRERMYVTFKTKEEVEKTHFCNYNP